MKYLLLTLLFCSYMGAPIQAADESKEERKEAVAWVKNSMVSKKKMITAAKKVKNEKSADKFAKEIAKIYADLKVDGESTAMGDSAPAKTPSGEIYTAEAAKKEAAMKKLDEELDKEQERIEELNLESSSLKKALEQMKKIRDLLG